MVQGGVYCGATAVGELNLMGKVDATAILPHVPREQFVYHALVLKEGVGRDEIRDKESLPG